jgi:hypothetical protein
MLDEPARFRLLHRLSGMRGEEVSGFWDGLFGPEGLFNSFTSGLANIHLLLLIAGTVPDRVARLVEDGLTALGPRNGKP